MEKTGTLLLKWKPFDNAHGCNVEQLVDRNWKTIVRIENLKITSILIPDLKTNTEYHIRVVAYRYDENRKMIAGEKQDFFCLVRPDKTSATYPVGIPLLRDAKNMSEGIVVNWEPAPGANMYRLYRRKGKERWTKVGDTTQSCYVDTDAEVGVQYRYTVRCVSDDGKRYMSSYNLRGIPNI